MKYLIHIILLINLSFSVDILSIQLPENVKSLSYAGYGIASRNNYVANPASLSASEKSYFEFSGNQWLFDIKGSYLGYIDKNLLLSAYYWKVDDIEFYEDTPSSSPLDTFGSKTFFMNLAQGFSFQNHHFGYSTKYKHR